MRLYQATILKCVLAMAVVTGASSGIAQESEGPIVTARSGESDDALRLREAIAYSYELPRGAPSEDYPLVAWCEALVNGHIALGQTLTKPDPLDQEIVRLAKLEAADFGAALAAATPRQSAADKERAQLAAAAASAQWVSLLAQSDETIRSQAFGLFFGLPGRCEHAARRIRSNITTPPASLKNVGLGDRGAVDEVVRDTTSGG